MTRRQLSLNRCRQRLPLKKYPLTPIRIQVRVSPNRRLDAPKQSLRQAIGYWLLCYAIRNCFNSIGKKALAFEMPYCFILMSTIP